MSSVIGKKSPETHELELELELEPPLLELDELLEPGQLCQPNEPKLDELQLRETEGSNWRMSGQNATSPLEDDEPPRDDEPLDDELPPRDEELPDDELPPRDDELPDLPPPPPPPRAPPPPPPFLFQSSLPVDSAMSGSGRATALAAEAPSSKIESKRSNFMAKDRVCVCVCGVWRSLEEKSTRYGPMTKDERVFKS